MPTWSGMRCGTKSRQAIGRNPNAVEPAVYRQLREQFSVEQLVLLIAFAGIMAATNLFNNVAKVDLDEVLYAYTKKEGVHGAV